MSNQSRSTGQRQDVEQKRREYLAKKTSAWYGIFVVGILAAGLFWCWAHQIATIVIVCGNAFLAFGLLAVFTILVFIAFQMKIREFKAIPYVPPVRKQLAEQIAALPAEAILVRGSDQPASAPDELLRSAHEGETTEAGELVRAGQVAKEA